MCEEGEDCMSDNLEKYTEYNKHLRTWLLAFGIGAIVLLVTTEELAQPLKQAQSFGLVAMLLLTGAILQILIAFINKTSNWYQFDLQNHASKSRLIRRWQASWAWIGNHYWIDFVIDVASLLAYVIAITNMWRILA